MAFIRNSRFSPRPFIFAHALPSGLSVKSTYVDPKIRYTPRERLRHALLKRFEGKPFEYMFKFDRFLNRYKSRFYIEIFNILKINFLKTIKKQRHSDSYHRRVYPSNRYTLLQCGKQVPQVEYEEEEEINFLQKDYIKAVQNKRRRHNNNIKDFKELIKLCKNSFNYKKNINLRNPILLARLREIILSKVILRVNKIKRNSINEFNIFKQHYVDKAEQYRLEAQMEQEVSAQGVDQTPKSESYGNTLNESRREESVGIPTATVSDRVKLYRDFASAESSSDYADLTNRFFPYDTYEWYSSDARGKKIVDLTLPLDFISKHPNSPNCTLFSSYAYWDGDIEVKIMLNSNKFQIGSLQMAWYYGQDYEQNFDRRDNVYIASQQAHCVVMASSSNEGYIYIPFRYYKPKMGTKARLDDPGKLNLGRLTVRVLNQLSTPSTTYNACNFTISFRFIKSNFSGMVARDLGSINLEAQMFSLRNVNAALSLLTDIQADPQRDNPPDIRPARPLIPWSAHSWSTGDALEEPINTLRLQATGQTPHPLEVIPKDNEMRISSIVNKFGLVKIVEWRAQQRRGQLVFALAGSPQLEHSEYYSQVFDGTVCYAMPPITVLSNLFAYWRGSIGIRADVVASPFHTGRLIIGYIPRVLKTPTLEQLKSSPHMIFDLQGESRQFYFRVPYIADRPWWPTKNFGSNVLPPSYVYCMILNELVPMDNVVDTVDINLYIHGCDDFELSIPTTPRIGLSTYNCHINFPKTNVARTKDGYTPVYIGRWRYVADSTVNVMRYGNVSDHVVQFLNLKEKTVYRPDSVRNDGVIVSRNKNMMWYIVGANVDVKNGFCPYALYFDTIADAKSYAEGQTTGESYTEDSDWFLYSNGKRAEGTIYFTPVSVKDLGDMEYEGNMDERQNIEGTSIEGILPMVSSTKSGLITFGEQFNDLKTLCRRYQMYMTYNKTQDVSNSHYHSLKIPALPQGIPLKTDQLDLQPFFNTQREGVIPICASAFRFYRGGLRFRLVWRSSWDCTLRVEHRPDERLDTLDIRAPAGHRGIVNNGYAILVQNTAINNILEFEVPFYQCGLLGFLQNPKIEDNLESYHFSLGNIYLNINSQNAGRKIVAFDLYYALADDCRFSVFQGFPSMMAAPDELLELQAQMFNNIKSIINNSKSASEKADKVMEKLDSILPDVKSTTSTKSDVGEAVVSSVVTAAAASITNDQKQSMYEWITSTIPKQFQTSMINFFSQIVHCIINPTIKTICWSLASFLAGIGVLASSIMGTFCDGLKKIIQYLHKGAEGIPIKKKEEQKTETAATPPNQTQNTEASKLEANAGEETTIPDEVSAGLVGTVVASIAAGLGSIGRIPKNIPDFTKGCWDNLGKFSFTANHLTTFFKNNLSWIMKAYRWVISKLFKSHALTNELTDSTQVIKDFAHEALTLLDESNARKCEVHPKWNMRVYMCAAMASALLVKLADNNTTIKSPALVQLCRDMIKKRDSLVKYMLSPPVKFEPYVMGLYGITNIGKSHLCQEIGKQFLREINYKTYDELVFTRTNGNEFWNGCRNQPICLYDDFINIQGESGLQQVGELFCLKSRAIFNPPQAAIEEKHIRYNPLLVFLAMNDPFPKVAGISCLPAFYRRRDILIKAIPNLEFYKKHSINPETGSPKQFPRGSIKNYEHLLFGIHETAQANAEAPACIYSYKELLKIIVAKFKIHYENELDAYYAALREAFEFYPDDDELVTGDLAETVEKMQTNLTSINKYRFESTCELKVFLTDILTKVTTKEHKDYAAACAAFEMYRSICPFECEKMVEGSIYHEDIKNRNKKTKVPDFQAQMDIELEPAEITFAINEDDHRVESHELAEVLDDKKWHTIEDAYAQLDRIRGGEHYDPYPIYQILARELARRHPELDIDTSDQAVEKFKVERERLSKRDKADRDLRRNKAIPNKPIDKSKLMSKSMLQSSSDKLGRVMGINKEPVAKKKEVIRIAEEKSPSELAFDRIMGKTDDPCDWNDGFSKKRIAQLDRALGDKQSTDYMIASTEKRREDKTLCNHWRFNPEWVIDEDDPTRFVSMSDIEVFCPDSPCLESNGIKDCLLKQPYGRDLWFKVFMQDWLNLSYCKDRMDDYIHQRTKNIPQSLWKYETMVDHGALEKLVDKDPLKKTPPVVNAARQDKRFRTKLKNVYDEIKKLADWAWTKLKQAGGVVIDILWWGLKLTTILCGFFAVIGIAANRVFPERKEIRYQQKLVKDQIPYEHSFQNQCGKLDADLVIQKELLDKGHFTQLNNNVDEGQMVSSGDYKTFGLKGQNVRDVAIKLVGNLAKEQEQAVFRCIKRNTMYVIAEYSTTIVRGRILGLVGNYALSIDHYHDKFSKLPMDARVYLQGNGFKIPIKYSDLKYCKFSNSSLGYYALPPQVPLFKNILKFFARQQDHRHLGPSMMLVEPSPNDFDTLLVSEQYGKRIFGLEIPASNGFESFVIPDGYQYCKGGRGVCGSVLVSSHLQHPIIGIHVAGDVGGRTGISEAVCYETFKFLEEKSRIYDVHEPNMFEDTAKFMKPQSNVMVLGAIQNEFTHHEPTISKVIPTECHGQIFPVYCEPPVLSESDPRIQDTPFNPLQSSVNKHGLVTDNFPDEYVELAYKDLNNMILANVPPVRLTAGKLPKSIAIVGSPLIPGFEKIDFNTSEGFPFSACRPRKGYDGNKKWLLSLEENETGYIYKGCHPLLQQVLKIKKEQRLNKIIPFTVFVDCMKDRKLPIEKATKPGKVRIFSISPLDFTIQCRQYFMDFTVSYQNARLNSEHAIGIDVNSLEWTILAQNLLNNSQNILTLDYKGFGPSLNLVCVQKAIQIICNWYQFNGDNSSENLQVREIMGYEIMYSNHLLIRTIYKTFCGLPSGNPLTVILNSLVNCLYVRITWIQYFTTNLNFKQVEVNPTLQSFHNNVKFYVYGDDLIMSVKEKVVNCYNSITMADILNQYKIEVSNATKEADLIAYSSITSKETTFLKNNFKPHPIRKGVFLAALDRSSVEDTLNWTFKEWKTKLRQASLEASDATIRNAFGHGPEYFHKVYSKIEKYWLHKREVIRTPNWSEIDRQNYN